MDNDVIKKIENGQIKMRSKFYFIFRDVLVIIASALIFVISVLLVSLIFFALRESGVSVLPRLGSAGFRIYLAVFPWIPVLIALILTFLLSLVLKKYSFSYRRPLLYIPLLIITILIGSGILIGTTSLHKNIRDFSHRNHTALVEPLYDNFQNMGKSDVTLGQVLQSSPSMITIMSDDNNQYTISITNQTQFPFGDEIDNTEHVAIIGQRNGNKINAIAIRRLSDPDDYNFTPPPPGFFLFQK